MLDPLKGELIFVDKPLDWTSFNVVKYVRGVLIRRLGLKKVKVGHAGTLDPLATGVMIICTGGATKRIEELQNGVKEYVATVALGATTPSFDLETPIDACYPTDHITRPLAEEALARFVGRIEQVPPTFSACKVDGKRAYKMARKGRDVELKPKVLVIDAIELLHFSPTELQIRVVCSKGTYIRALARDIGEALQSGAHLTALRRTRVGNVSIDQCLSVQQAADFLRDAEMVMPEDPEQPASGSAASNSNSEKQQEKSDI